MALVKMNEHNFTSFGRCSKCQMRTDYYRSSLEILYSWLPEERQESNGEWERKVAKVKECEGK